MPNFEVYDLPLKIYMTESKAAALELLRSRPDIQYGPSGRTPSNLCLFVSGASPTNS